MKPSELFLALTDIDETYINTPRAAALKGVRQRILRKWVAVAACACVMLAAGYGVYGIHGAADAPVGIVYPDENEKVNFTTDYTVEMLSGEPITYSEIIQDATAIVVADIMTEYDAMPESYFGAKRANVTVREVLKGNVNVGDTLVVCDYAYRTKNGNFGTPDGGLLLETGNCVLLFLRYNEYPAPDGLDQPRYTIGGYDKYFLDRDGKFHLSASYGDHPMSNYFLKTHIEYEPKTIEEYRELIGSVEVSQTTTTNAVYPDESEKTTFEYEPII